MLKSTSNVDRGGFTVMVYECTCLQPISRAAKYFMPMVSPIHILTQSKGSRPDSALKSRRMFSKSM